MARCLRSSAVDRRVVHQRQFYILHARGLRQEVVVLEDETNLAVAQDGTLSIAAHLAHAHTIQIVFALDGVSRQPSWLSRVDLPEPDLPMMVTNSPSYILKLTPFRA